MIELGRVVFDKPIFAPIIPNYDENYYSIFHAVKVPIIDSIWIPILTRIVGSIEVTFD